MTRIIVALSLVAMLFVAMTSTAFACGPYDWRCQAQQTAQHAQQRLQNDWNNASRDLTGIQNLPGQISNGAQRFGQAAQRGFFNCTNWRQDARGNLYCAR